MLVGGGSGGGSGGWARQTFPSPERGGPDRQRRSGEGLWRGPLTPTWLAMLAGLPLSGGGKKIRANSAAKNPNAAGVAPASGTISCSPPQPSPPWGRWRSMASTPSGNARTARKPSIFGNRRRNSSATAARLRSTVWAFGRVMGGLISTAVDYRTKQEQCQDGFRLNPHLSITWCYRMSGPKKVPRAPPE
jgi:hypothetical protein